MLSAVVFSMFTAFSKIGVEGTMIAVLGIIAVFVSLLSMVTGNVRGLGFAVVAYLLTGLLLQRREGQLSRKDGKHYSYYYKGYYGTSTRMPDPTVTWDWRVGVILLWLPWLVMVRGGDMIEFAFGMTRAAWQFAVLGYSNPKTPDWTKRRRVFRTLPQISETDQREEEPQAVQRTAKDVDLPIPQNGHEGPKTDAALEKTEEVVVGAGSSKN